MKKIVLFALIILSSIVTKAGDSISLYIFMLDDCIICQDYSPTLNKLHEEYGGNIQFVGYFPNFSSKQNKIDEFREKYNVKFPLKTDYFKAQCAKFEATITPEVVLYNNTKETILYKGRIDNKFYKLGRRRNVVTHHELKDALKSITSKSKIEVSTTEAIGCYINYSDAISKYQLK